MPLSRFKHWWVASQRKLRDGYADTREDLQSSLRYWRFAGVLVVLYVLFTLVLGIYWSRTPALFDVASRAEQRLGAVPRVPGTALTATLVNLTDTLLEKPGGYLANDLMPPGVWLDNMPAWELGVLHQVRMASRALRDDFYPAGEDKDLTLAYSRFAFNHQSWMMPASESQYRDGMVLTERYLNRLQGAAPQTLFAARPDTLNAWLEAVQLHLTLMSHRLSASLGPVYVPLGGEALRIERTPWRDLDQVFFEARGSGWALVHLLQAAEQDFAPLLAPPELHQPWQQLLRELQLSQRPLRTPVLMNGRGFGVLPNHSLVMASHLSRAAALLADIRAQLHQPDTGVSF